MKISNERQETWEKVHRKLNREVRMAHRDEGDPESQKKLRKRRKQLRRLARREKRAFDHHTEAEQSQAESFAVYVLED